VDSVIDWLGWTATAVFVTSYFCKRAELLRRVQMAGAAMWVIYGILVQAPPVVAANLLVLLAAAWTAARPSPVS
jgi:Bacterial inner membrane protein